MKTKKLFLRLIVFLFFLTTQQVSAQENINAVLCNKVIVGYWHSFDNQISTVLKLRDVPCHYNVVDVAFLEGASPSDPTMVFRLDTIRVEKESEFIDDIEILKKRGTKVIASIGGANGTVYLPDANAKTIFVNSLIDLIDKYGFEGLDIDIESNVTVGGDTDYQNPTAPMIKNLISACKEIKAKYGPDFWITMAPEVAYVQGGLTAYAGIWGAYLPIIYGLRNELNFIHVQYYNTGGQTGSDGNTYNVATADFIVAMNDMLLSGFKLGNGQLFPALRQDQVAFGLPSTTGAGNGYMVPSEVVKALNYLTKGTSFGGKYTLSKTFPDLRGIMTWSVNWDNKAPGNYAFGKTFSQYFCNSTNLCNPVTDINNEIIRQTDFKIFPDPTADKIYFEKQSYFESVDIYSSSGNRVMTIKNFNSTELNISELPAGLYFIRFLDKERITRQSVIKY